MASTRDGIVKLGTNSYQIRVRATCPRTGRRKEVERVRECTLTEARAMQHEWRAELIESLRVEKAPRVRLRDFAASWLTGKRGTIKIGTAKNIALVWDVHVAPTKIADLFVDDIRTEDVEDWLAAMRSKLAPSRKRGGEAKPYKASFVRGVYNTLRQIIRAACARARIANPCEGVKPPKVNRPRDNYLREHEAAKVLAYVREHEPKWYAAVIVSLTTGLRWSEVSALKFGDLDETNGVIRVVRGQYRGYVSTTKNGESEENPRIVPLLPEVVTALREHRQRLIKDQHPGLAEGWIFAPRSMRCPKRAPDDPRVLYSHSPLRAVLARACEAVGAGRRISGHGLRHTANDLLRRVASDVVTRSTIGHASAAMSRRYSHVDDGERQEAARQAFGSVLGGKVGGRRKRPAPSSSGNRSKAAM